MLKNKFKTLLIILMLIIISLSPLCFAADENPSYGTEEDPAYIVPPTATPEDSTHTASPTATPEDTAIQSTKADNSSKDDTKHGDQYIIGDSIVIDYVIDGNLYVLANNVTIKSQVIGNVFIAAQNVTITEQGYISNSLYVATKSLHLSGIVSDLYASGENIDISGYVYRDIHCAVENITILGTIGRNASIASENISFEKENSNSSNKTESVISKKRIMGNLTYSAKEEKTINKDFVEGTINFEKLETINFNFKINQVFVILSVLILVLAIWGLLKWIAPKFLEKTSDLVSKKIYKTILLGLAGLLLIPIVSVLLILGIVTSSVGFILLISYVVLLLISEVIFAISLSNFIVKKFGITSTGKFLLILLLVTLAIYGLELVPVISIIVSIIATLTGLGIIIRSLVSKEYK